MASVGGDAVKRLYRPPGLLPACAGRFLESLMRDDAAGLRPASLNLSEWKKTSPELNAFDAVHTPVIPVDAYAQR